MRITRGFALPGTWCLRMARCFWRESDRAGMFDAGSRELLKEPTDVIDELLSACDVSGGVSVGTVLGPRASSDAV